MNRSPQKPALPLSRLLILMTLLLMLALLLFAGVLGWASLRQHALARELLDTQSAGRVLAVSQSGGFFNRALVETDTGYYALQDGMSAQKGESLSLQLRGDQSRYLCDSARRCVELASASVSPGGRTESEGVTK